MKDKEKEKTYGIKKYLAILLVILAIILIFALGFIIGVYTTFYSLLNLGKYLITQFNFTEINETCMVVCR